MRQSLLARVCGASLVLTRVMPFTRDEPVCTESGPPGQVHACYLNFPLQCLPWSAVRGQTQSCQFMHPIACPVCSGRRSALSLVCACAQETVSAFLESYLNFKQSFFPYCALIMVSAGQGLRGAGGRGERLRTGNGKHGKGGTGVSTGLHVCARRSYSGAVACVACAVLVACCAVPHMVLTACSPQPLLLQVGFIAFFWFIMMVAQKTLNFNRR